MLNLGDSGVVEEPHGASIGPWADVRAGPQNVRNAVKWFAQLDSNNAWLP